MFNLIVSTIAIALSASLLLVTVNYGSGFLESNQKMEEADDIVNAAFHVKDAYLKASQSGDPSLSPITATSSSLQVSQLISGGYLNACPGGWQFKLASNNEFSGIPESTPVLTHVVSGSDVCFSINKRTSNSGIGLSEISCVQSGTSKVAVVPLIR